MASRADRLYQLLNTTPSSTAILLAVVCIAFAAQQGGFIWAYCRRSSSLTKFSAVPLFVPLPALLGGSLFYLVKAILTYPPAPYRRLAILSAAGVFVMLVFKPINLFRTNARHERRLSVRLAFIDTNTGGQDPRAIERRLKFLSEKAGRYLVCLSGMLMAAAMLVFWSEWPRSTVQGVVSALRSISSLVPRWCLLVPAFFLLMYPFKRPSLSVLAILTSFTFFGTAYITGAHWGWLIVAAWMSITRLMHIRVGFHFRQMEKWWDEFLRQHGLITTIAYRIL